MANQSTSAEKRHRQSLIRRDRNRAVKSVLRGLLRKVREALAEGNLEAANATYKLIVKKFDQAAAKNVIHANLAARVKSRISARLKAAKTQPAPAAS